ncbi:MAG TPA: DUF3247 family protein [Luteibacter sp.]|jgi:Protein of unknown function (DUF3247)|nr:DUF3247 family protein [Luteibacter sp.]
MGRNAEHVYTEPGAIARIEAWIAELPGAAVVRIVEIDGRETSGVVSVRPTVQAFRDGNENEGINGVVTLEDPDRPGWTGTIWLDRIERVDRLAPNLAQKA